MLTKAIENAQKKVEGNNFATRKHLLEYDQVMNEQREIIYGERRRVLFGENLRESVMGMIKAVIENVANRTLGESEYAEEWDLKEFSENLYPIIPLGLIKIKDEELNNMTKEKFIDSIYLGAAKLYELKEAEIAAALPVAEGEEPKMREIERVIMLKVIDSKWMDHIDDMDQMRQGIGLHAYAQRDPLIEYKYVSYDMFNELSYNIQEDTVKGLFHVRIVREEVPQREEVAKPIATNKDDSLQKQPKVNSEEKIGRNDPCPCGSGLKYKNCCGKDAE